MNLSDSLKRLFALWMSGRGIANEVGSQQIGQGYPIFSWYSIMCGMGIFPDPKDLRPPTPAENCYRMAEVDNLLERSALNFRDQRAVLQAIPPAPSAKPLQLYFW